MSSDKSYQVGGSLEYQHPTYVVRQADEQLYDGLKNGEFCYVLNSRQMGKSSLWVQTIEKLKAEGICCGVIDLTEIGTVDITAEKWYLGVIRRLVKDFDLSAKFNYRSWWKERDLLSPLQRFGDFIEDVLLVELSANMVIFIDEIDSILKINFKDDFFAFIRACYNKRVNNPAYKRLTFCLLGVATPSDLIQDKQRTPFNIGCAVELTGFTFEEAKSSLTAGLAEKVDDAERVLQQILDWTGGQPFLTQKLCKLVVEKAENSKANVEELVQRYIIENWEAQDEPEHLRTIRDRILKNEECAGRLLGLYQQVLEINGVRNPVSSEKPGFSPDEAIELQLSGLVVKKNGKLQVYNQIYQQVFNRDWIEGELAKLRPYSEAITAWLASKREDTSRLLRGEALREALQWKVGKSLSVDDYDFLDASQQFALRESEQARQILEEANREAKQLIAEAKEGTKLERAGVMALRLFESKTGEIEALLVAMEAGQALHKLVRGRRLLDYPATSPLLALQQILLFIRERNQFRGHQSSVNSVCFSPNGEYLATASDDKTAKLWDLAGNLIAEFRGHQFSVNSVCFSPNGEYLATASRDKTAKLWDLKGHQIAEFRGHQSSVNSVYLSPNGEYLATASDDKTAKLWDLAGNLIAEFRGHQSSVNSVCFSPNGEYLATASDDKAAKLWNFKGHQIAEFHGHQDWVRSVCLSPNGEYLATASDDKTAKLWDLAGNLIAEFRGHQNWVRSVCFSPNGEYLASASHDRTAKLWDLAENQIAEFCSHQSSVNSVCLSPHGEYLATASLDKTVKLWDLKGHQIAEFRGHKSSVNSVCLSPHSKYLATASDDGTAKLWDLKGNQIAEFRRNQSPLLSVCFNPHGTYLATASGDTTAKLWDLAGHQIAAFRGHQSSVNSVCFSPHGAYLATASTDNTAKLWDLKGNQIAEFRGHQSSVNSVCFSPNGEYLATASRDKTAKLWDLKGHQIAEFRGHQSSVNSVCFSPNGEYLATASSDNTAKLWDLAGNQIAEFRGHQSSVNSVCFSPNGEYLATASSDNTAKLWDLAGNQIAEFRGHQSWVLSVCFSPNGEYLATASRDETAKLWRVEGLEELLARGCEWLKFYFASHPEARERLQVCGDRRI